MNGARRLAALGLVGVATLALNPGVAYATYTQDHYIGRFASEVNTYLDSTGSYWITCVAASALTHKNYINLNDVSKATIKAWFDEGYTYNKRVYPGGRDFGLDPRAWAKLLYFHTPSGYYYNDYPAKLSPTWSQATSNRYIVAGLRVAGDTVGALVQHGEHAFDIIGYQTSVDPLDSAYTLYGFYVIDPWRGGGNYSKYGGTYNLQPNTYRTLSDWNSHYFLTYTEDDTSPPTWTNEYVVILRSSDGAPSDYPSIPYSDAYGGAQIADYQEPSDPGYATSELGDAVLGGLASNGLVDSNGLGVRLSHPTVGDAVFVSSAVADFPSYYLVEVREGSTTAALAMVESLSDGLHFAALAATGPGFQLPEDAAARAEFATQHFSARSASLVWGWSAETMSPFYPVWQGIATDGSKRYLSPDGAVSAKLHLTPKSVPIVP